MKNTVKKNICLLFSIVLLSVFCLSVDAATLYFMPQRQEVFVGDTFVADVRLNTQGDEINTVKGELIFDTNFLELIDFSDGDSILSLWPQSPVVQQGKLNFIGGSTKGFLGDGSVVKLIFKANSIGQDIISFSNNSKVLLNDGRATPAGLSFLQASYVISEIPEGAIVISSRSHPDQNKWYSNSFLNLKWEFNENNFYSYILGYDALAELDNTPDRPEGELLWLGEMTYPDLDDGIYYFHLKESKDGTVWGPKTTFRAMIDTEIPEAFEAKIGQDEAIFESNYFVSFSTTDRRSGIDHYEILESTKKDSEGLWETATSPYLLKDQDLKSIIQVKAIDRAGNERLSEIKPESISSGKIFPYWLLIVIPIIAGVIWWILRILKNKYKKSKILV